MCWLLPIMSPPHCLKCVSVTLIRPGFNPVRMLTCATVQIRSPLCGPKSMPATPGGVRVPGAGHRQRPGAPALQAHRARRCDPRDPWVTQVACNWLCCCSTVAVSARLVVIAIRRVYISCYGTYYDRKVLRTTERSNPLHGHSGCAPYVDNYSTPLPVPSMYSHTRCRHRPPRPRPQTSTPTTCC